jgi:HK97 family phage major capsid protein
VQSAASYWSEIIDLLYTVRDGNEEPNALVWSSKAARQYAKAVATDGQPLQLPSDVASIRRIPVNKIPSYTQGTMVSRATDVFAGDWSQLLIGQRLGISLQVLTEKYADTGEIGIIATWRGDVQPARPAAFAVYRGLQGAL